MHGGEHLIDGTGSALGLAGAGVRVLLVGTGRHRDDSPLLELPSVEPTIRALESCLITACEVDPGQISTLIDPANPLVFAEELTQAARQAEDALLVWFVGHGLVDRDNALHLATHATRDLTVGRAAWQALPYEEIREAVRACRAASVVIVLDCCFAGRATVPASGDDDLGSQLATRGAYLLASAARDKRALAPPDEPLTLFTGTAIRLLNSGDPALGPRIRLLDLYRHVKRSLRSRGGPEPQQWAVNEAGSLVLARNPAFAPRPALRRRAVDQHEDVVPGVVPVQDLRAPWPGLAAYGPDDAELFHGRAALTARLVAQAARRARYGGGPLAVIGSSGAGKSSLLAAGLLPSIGRGELAIPGSAAWPQLSVSPGSDPIGALVARIAPAAGAGVEETADLIRATPSGLTELIRRLLARRADRYPAATAERLVLVVDQLEELYTVCENERDRNAFIEALCAASGAELDPDSTTKSAANADPDSALVGLD